MRVGLLLLAGFAVSLVALAEIPADVWKVFSAAAEGLANGDASVFLDQCDRNMPGYSALRANVEGLVNGNQVTSTIVPVSDEGDDQRRSLELDWLLALNDKQNPDIRKDTRRAILKARVSREGRRWKIVALEPVDFFRP
jgi:hypothetical protein